MKASDLDLYRPYYKRGDYVWVIAPNGKMYEGVVLNGYEGNYGRAKRETFTMYSVFTLHGDKFAPPPMLGSKTKRPNAAYVRIGSLVPRMRWEERPLQRLEENPEQEVTLERLQQQIKDSIRLGA